MKQELTQNEKRIAIAEHFGWKKVAIEPRNWDGPSVRDTIGEQEPNCPEAIPQYFTDLNACHEAENALSDELHQDFYDALWTLIRVGHAFVGTSKLHRLCCSAPAALRAEAIWLTICKTP